jgi:hypothetical protein
MREAVLVGYLAMGGLFEEEEENEGRDVLDNDGGERFRLWRVEMQHVELEELFWFIGNTDRVEESTEDTHEERA